MTSTQTVELLNQHNYGAVDSWTDLIELSRNARNHFSVTASKFADDPDDSSTRRWRIWENTTKLSTPSEVLRAIESILDTECIELDWVEATSRIAELDWITAAVIASEKEVTLPALPTTSSLSEQRSLRTLGKVSIGVEWGYDRHDLTVSIKDWLSILHGEDFSAVSRYYYEGERFDATWFFDRNRKPQLEVSYGNDGATGWTGRLNAIRVIEGKSIDGIDLAQLMLNAPVDK